MSDVAAATAANAPAASAAAVIADVSYRNYDGELKTRALRWWTITLATIRANVNRKRFGYWIPAGIIFVIYFFLGISHYMTQSFQERMAEANPLAPLPSYNAYATTLYTALAATNLLVAITTMTVGAASIAADNRANALLVYLSKPITRTDYLLGKWMGVFLLLAALTLAPALLMFLFFTVTYASDGFLKDNPTLILRLLGASLAQAAINASLILGFSAWSKSPRLAGAFYAAFYVISGILAGVFGHIVLVRDADVKQPQVSAVAANASVAGVVNGIGMNLYDVSPDQTVEVFRQGRRRRRRKNGEETATSAPNVLERPNLPAMLAIGDILIVLPLAAAAAKVRAVEVVRG